MLPPTEASARRGRASSRSGARRRAREFVLQGVYQWLVAGTPPGDIARQFREQEEFGRADAAFADWLLAATVESSEELSGQLQPLLDRPVALLSPVERAVLLMAGQELRTVPGAEFGAPLGVVINEAVELAKRYGGTDGYKYVNGVLDRLAAQLRGEERSAHRG